MSAPVPPPSYTVRASGAERRFEISLGLVEGYGEQTVKHSIYDVLAAHHAWQREHNAVLGVWVVEGIVSYGWPEEGGIHCAQEVGVLVSGTANVLYQAHVSEGTFLRGLLSLAAALGAACGQSRVYLTFAGTAYILEQQGAEVPA